MTTRKGKNVEKKKKIVKKKSVWKLPGIIQRIDQLILDRTIAGENGYAKAYETIRAEFNEQLKDPGVHLDRRLFDRKVNERIWTKSVLKQVRDAIRVGMDIKDVHSHLAFIPWGQFRYMWNRLKGTGARCESADFIRGVGRLATEISMCPETPYLFPNTDYSDPYPIDGDSASVCNGVNLGIPFSRVIMENPARQAFLNATHAGDGAIILTNFLNLDWKKASGAGVKVFRSLMSGRNVNPAVFDPEYAEEVRRILESGDHNDLIYETLAEIFMDSLAGWAKIAGPKKTPVFSGPVLVVLGYQEEAFIATAAYWEAHYFWQKSLNQLHIQKRMLINQISRIQNELEKKSSVVSIHLQKALEDLKKNLKYIEDLIARTRMSNISDRDFRRYFNKVMHFVIGKIEETIPYSRVVGTGNTFFTSTINEKIIEVHIPPHVRSGSSSDMLLADFCGTYSSRALKNKLADAVVICHPYALGYKWTKRENDRDGQRNDADIFVAPICVDARFIAKTLANTIRTVPGIARSVFAAQFEPGMLRLRFGKETIQPDVWSGKALQDFAQQSEHRRSLIVSPSEYIWIMVATDPHWGNAGKDFVVTSRGERLGPTEAAIELMRRNNLLDENSMPVHMVVVNDDPTQGHNFETQQRPEVHKMPYIDLQQWMINQTDRISGAGSREEVSSLVAEMREVALRQIIVRGEHWTSDQIAMMFEMGLRANVDFFDAVLRRALKANIVVRGISEIQGEIYDTRDPGLINFGTGNHIYKSTNGEMVEGFLYATLLRAMLESRRFWGDRPNLLKRLVRAPLYSNQFVSYGTVRVADEYEWGIDFRDKPVSMKSWEDPLLGWTRTDLRRGNYSSHMNGRVTLKTCGDKHFGACTITSFAIYVMGMPGTHTDQFAEMAGGFPPNNTGVVFVGIPVLGPHRAPVLTRSLSFARLKEIFASGGSFQWDTFLIRPA